MNFNDLLNVTFQDGPVHIKQLESLFKILVKHLKLEDLKVSVEDHQDFGSTNGTLDVPRIESVLNLMPKSEDIAKNLCKNETNQMLDILKLLNLTKRVEAVEISIHTLTSLMENALKMEARFDDKLENMKMSIIQNHDVINTIPKEDSKASKLSPLPTKESSKASTIIEKASSVSSKAPSKASSMTSQSKVTVSIAPLIDVHESSNEPEKSHSSDLVNTKLDNETIERLIEEKMIEYKKELSSVFSKLTRNFCEIQKNVKELHNKTEDLMFACEQNDMKNDVTLADLKDFNSKVFCLKTDVKTLMIESKEDKEKFVLIDEKYETMNNVKTNKSYVDEQLSYKSFNTDLEKFVVREDFEPAFDIMTLKLSLVENHFATLQLNLKKSLACFKSELDEKSDKNEITKFKKVMSVAFEGFLNELKALLHPIMKTQIGLGGKSDLLTELNCISCEAKVGMKKSSLNVPQLKPLSDKFMNKLNKNCIESTKTKSNSEFRRIFCNVEKIATAESLENFDKLNFLFDQQCYVISQDNTIVKADPLKCLSNPKYFKP